MALTGRTLGPVLAALVWLESAAWVTSSLRASSRFDRAAADDPSPLTFRVYEIQTLSGEAEAQVPPLRAVAVARRAPRPLCAPARAILDHSVRDLPFLQAARFRQELRVAIADQRAVGQIVQALTALVFSRAFASPPRRRCWGGHHTFQVRRDDVSGVGRVYLECVRCGKFRNTLFGDRISVRQQYELRPNADGLLSP